MAEDPARGMYMPPVSTQVPADGIIGENGFNTSVVKPTFKSTFNLTEFPQYDVGVAAACPALNLASNFHEG